MSYGTLKIDTITFTDGGIDKSVSVSGLVQNPSFSGNITATGTISGNIIQGQTISGVTVTGTTAAFTSGTFISLTGTTTQGTTATFASGVFTTQISGATITGNAAAFTTVTGGIATITSGVFASGTAAAPSVSVGATDNGIYSPGTDQVAISTNGTGRLFVDADGNVKAGNPSTTRLEITSGTVGVGERIQSYTNNYYIWGLRNESNDLAIESAFGGNIIFRASNDGIASSPGTATERMRLDSSGRLGLGTSSPTAKMEIVENAGGLDLVTPLRLSGTALNNDDGWKLQFYNNTASLEQGSLLVQYKTTGSWKTSLTSTNNVTFDTAGNERVRIDSAGRVGIGSNAPNGLLALGFADAGSASLEFRTTSYSNLAQIVANNPSSDTGEITFRTRTGGSAFDRVKIDGSGRLLVGTTTTSAAPLTVNGTVEANGSLYRAVFGNGYLDGDSGGVAGGNPAEVQIQSATSSRPAILSLGGGQGSGEALGAISFFNSNNTDGKRLRASIVCGQEGATANEQGGLLTFSTTADGASSPTERMRIRSSGGIVMFGNEDPILKVNSARGAGTSDRLYQGYYSATDTTDGTVSFQVFTNGNVQNTNNSYGAISDVKLKENIVDATSQWDDIKALQVRKYNFKEGQTHTQIGLLAQEVELVSPGLVNESPDRDEDGNDLGTVTKSVNYSVLYMKAVKALQEAMERIETLETEMAAVKAKLP